MISFRQYIKENAFPAEYEGWTLGSYMGNPAYTKEGCAVLLPLNKDQADQLFDFPLTGNENWVVVHFEGDLTGAVMDFCVSEMEATRKVFALLHGLRR